MPLVHAIALRRWVSADKKMVVHDEIDNGGHISRPECIKATKDSLRCRPKSSKLQELRTRSDVDHD